MDLNVNSTPLTLNVPTNYNKNSGITFTTDYKFYDDTTIITYANANDPLNPCINFSYLFEKTII